MITSSLIIGIASMLLTWLAKLWTMKILGDRELRAAELEAMNARAKINKDVREYRNERFEFTRQFIALATTICVMIIPFFAVLFYQWQYPVDVIMGGYTPEIHFGYNVVDKGFWPFTSDSMHTVWKSFRGVVITPWHTDMFAWLMGSYFGERLGGNRR